MAKKTVVLKDSTIKVRSRKLIDDYKKRYPQYFEIKELKELFDISLQTAIELSNAIKRTKVKFKNVEGEEHVSNIGFLLHKNDIKRFLLSECEVQVIYRKLLVWSKNNAEADDYFWRKEKKEESNAMLLLEAEEDKNEVERIIDELLTSKNGLVSRSYFEKKLFKLDEEGEESEETYSSTSMTRLFACLPHIKIKWKGKNTPTIKFIKSDIHLRTCRDIISRVSSTKVIKREIEKPIEELTEQIKPPYVIFKEADSRGIKNLKGEELTHDDIAKTYYDEPLIDIRNTTERVRYLTMLDNYELPNK